MNSVIEAIRNATAKREAIYRYAAAQERFAELEQVLVAEGRYDEAPAAHELGLVCLRAYRNEIDDPLPEGRGTLPPYRYVAEDRG